MFRGAIYAGITAFLDWEINRKGTSCSDVLPLGLETKGFEVIVLDSWVVKLETMAVATHLCLLGRGGPIDAEESGWVMAPKRRFYKSLIWPQ